MGGGGGSPVGGSDLGRLVGGGLLLGSLALESRFLVVATGEGGTVVLGHPWCRWGREDYWFFKFGGRFGDRWVGLGRCGERGGRLVRFPVVKETRIPVADDLVGIKVVDHYLIWVFNLDYGVRSSEAGLKFICSGVVFYQDLLTDLEGGGLVVVLGFVSGLSVSEEFISHDL